MTEEKDAAVKIPSGCASPARLEKTDSSSSRQSASPDHWDSEPWDRTARIRPSSWDDSDDDSYPKPETAGSQPSRIYSSETKECQDSISSEINELKKQFFESLEKEDVSSSDSLRVEKLKQKLEVKLKYDRRHSPARVRRRSRSSSSSSPVQESQKSPETKEKSIGPDFELVESDSPSPRALEIDTRYYLNNFFSELRSKRISILDSVPDGVGKDDVLVCDSIKTEMLNDLNAPDLNDDGGYFCKTSRKLSQILEVEENKKDLEKSSEDSMEKTELFTREIRTPEPKAESPPIQTARSRRSEKVLQAGDGRQRKRGSYKSLSFEEFGNFEKVGRPSRGSLSERSGRMFGPKLDDDFIHLCAKTGKIRLSSAKPAKEPEMEKSFQFLCFANALGANQTFSAEPPPSREEDENLNKATAPGSPISGKSTDRSEQSRTTRTKSAQSRRRSDPQSPRFALSIGGDSARSLQLDDVNTPHSQRKDEETKTAQSKRSPEDSTGNSDKCSFRSEGAYESKTDRSLRVALESPSLESAKSSGSLGEHRNTGNHSGSRPSTRRSQRTGRDGNRASNAEHAPTVQDLDTCGNSPVESATSLKAKSASRWSEHSKKTPDSTRTLEDGLSDRTSDPRTARSHKIPKLGFPLDVVERSESQKSFCRSPRTAESEDVDPIQNSNPPSFGSRSGRFRKSTPRSRSATPKTSGSNSVRFGEEEKPPIIPPEEFESVYDALTNHTPVSASTRKSSHSRQSSARSENSAMRRTFTPKQNNAFEERPSGSSGKSPMRSWDENSPGSAGNISKSEQTRSRPASWTSAESKSTDVPPEIEKLDALRSGRTTSRSTTTEEYEEKEEHRSTPRSRSGADSDRQSNQRLSIINEVTFEDFETSTTSLEREEKDPRGESRPPSRRSRREVTPRSVGTISKDVPGESFTGKPPEEASSRKNPPDGGSWSELIETFEGSRDPSLFSEKNFPGFRSRREEVVSLSVYPSTVEALEKICDGSDDMKVDSFELSRKVGTPGSEKEEILEAQQQREEDFSFNIVNKESPLIEKVKAKEDGPPTSPQNLYYVDLDKGAPFGIGEFGDITWWSGGKSDSEDLDKPKDHGDGIHSLRSSEILLLKAQKREKEMKIQRQLWTELKEDFRDSKMLSSDRFPKVQSDSVSNRLIPVVLKTSKSDNSIDRRPKEGSEPGIYEFLNENDKRDNIQNELWENLRGRSGKCSWKNMADGSGSMESTREGSEFECEKTARLSRSMSDLTTRLARERYDSNEFLLNSSRTQLFEKPDSRNEKEDSVDLDIFLARKNEPETGVKSNSWLQVKSSEKSGKKEKTKMKKGLDLSREPYVEYLVSGKSRHSISGLKRRNSNCFQNFYKRFISVFCVTSNSSAATSK